MFPPSPKCGRVGVHAQDLAQHSTIQLTLDKYTHTALETQVEAL
jgi:hypothetical protein